MKRKPVSLMALVVLISIATYLFAHERYRIIGTLTKVEKTQVQVKATKDSKIYKIAVDDITVFRRDNDKVPAAELKAGSSVVVDAIGDSVLDLVAVEIRMVPAVTKSPVKK